MKKLLLCIFCVLVLVGCSGSKNSVEVPCATTNEIVLITYSGKQYTLEIDDRGIPVLMNGYNTIAEFELSASDDIIPYREEYADTILEKGSWEVNSVGVHFSGIIPTSKTAVMIHVYSLNSEEAKALMKDLTILVKAKELEVTPVQDNTQVQTPQTPVSSNNTPNSRVEGDDNYEWSKSGTTDYGNENWTKPIEPSTSDLPEPKIPEDQIPSEVIIIPEIYFDYDFNREGDTDAGD